MINKVRAYIHHHKMIEKGERVVVAVSGGADSMALLAVLHRLRNDLAIELVAAHMNHGLRGRDADEDADLVKSVVKTAGLPYFEKKVDVGALAKRKGLSLEDAARRARYAFFYHLLRRLPAQKIATGHQMHDQAETVILNLLRGAGSRGLRGIVPVRNRVLIRPCLKVSREEILAFLEREGIPYREDESNQSDLFRRNRIRHDLVPQLKRYNPRIEERLYDLAEIMRVENDFMEAQTALNLEKWQPESSVNAHAVDIQEFLALHEAIQRRIVKSILESRSLEQTGINQVHVGAVIRLCRDGHVGQKLSLPFATEVFRDYDRIIFRESGKLRSSRGMPLCPDETDKDKTEKGPTDCEYSIDNVETEVVIRETGSRVRLSKIERGSDDLTGQGVNLLDFDKIEFPLTFRHFRSGDRFHPLGMNGTKKLKCFFIDRKVPQETRKRILLLTDRKNILWIADMAVCESAKVTPATRICLKIEII